MDVTQGRMGLAGLLEAGMNAVGLPGGMALPVQAATAPLAHGSKFATHHKTAAWWDDIRQPAAISPGS